MVAAAATGDARFFARTGPHPLDAVAQTAGGTVVAPPRLLTEVAPPGLLTEVAPPRLLTEVAAPRLLSGVAPLQSAEPDQVSFLDNRLYAPLLAQTRAGAVIVHPDLASRVPPDAVAIVTAEPYLGWARVAALFHPPPPLQPGIHPAAVIDPAAQVDPTAEIGPLVVVGAGAIIGPRCRVAASAVIGAGVVLGPDCRIGASASLSHAILGARVYVYPGARIGQEGFGFAQGPQGFVSVPQLGRVLIEDDVEVGANSTVDRGSAQDTVIGAGSRLDNLVQIGHNVRLGRCCVVAAQAGISGSTVLEDFVVVAGQAGLSGHLHIGAKARIGAKAGVMRDVAAGSDVLGAPAMPVREFFRNVAVLRKLAGRDKGGREQG